MDKSIKQLEKASAGKRGDEKKSAQVASRKKKMERFGADKTEDGTKWKRSTMGERKFSVKDEMRNCRGRDAGMRLLMQQKGTRRIPEVPGRITPACGVLGVGELRILECTVVPALASV